VSERAPETVVVAPGFVEELLAHFPEALLTVTGDCMRPVLRPGDRVRLESARRRPPRLGDVVLVRQAQGLRLHRLIWKGRRTWRTKGDRSFHADPRLRPQDVIATVAGVEGGADVRRGWRRATLRSLLAAAAVRVRATAAAAVTAGLIALAAAPAGAQTCTFPASGTITGAVNTYYPGVGTPASGATSISVDTTAIRGATGTPIAAGDMLLVIQMQDAQINDGNTNAYGDGVAGDPATGATAVNNSGLYEYVVAVGAVAGGTVTVIGANATTGGLLNAYATAPTDDTGGGAGSRRGQRTFQVIRVPRYQTATLGAGLTAAAWNGRTGGVLAVDVAGTVTLGGTVSVDGMGFRGGLGGSFDGGGGANTDFRTTGATPTNGYKGEGIAGTPRNLTFVPGPSGNDGYPRGDKARGAPANGGGGGTDGAPASNSQNSGGGGGANGGTGGMGGNTWSSNLARGGYGGTAVAASATRIVLGGGGGAGSVNDCSSGAGANGGGIILLRAESLAGTGTLSARGDTAPNAGQDGAGGGGAGGSVVVVVASGTLAGLSVDVRGGNGGYSNLASPPAPAPGPACLSGTAHGPGGGGGGGVALLSGAAGTALVAGGVNGLTNVTSGVHNGATQAYGATAGAAGVLQTTLTRASVPGVQTCLASTRATIVGLRVDPSGTIEFATGLQRGTVGFNVYGVDQGRRRTRSTRLNAQLIAAPMPDSMTPIFYRVATAPVTTPRLLIEEIHRSGRRRMMGPFDVDDAALRAALEEAQARFDTPQRRVRELKGARVPAGATAAGAGWGWSRRGPVTGSYPGVKVEVAGPGTVTVPVADLGAAGLVEAVDAPRRLRVWNAGQPVPARLVRSGGATHLWFEVDGLASDYTDHNAYIVTSGLTPPPAPSVGLTRSGPAPLHGALVVQQDVLYAPFLPHEADPWVWDFLVSGSPAGPYAVDVPAVAPGPVPVRVIVVSLTDHEHTVEASLNGVAIGQVQFSGQAVAEIFGEMPAGAVHAGTNELTLAYAASASDPDDVGLAVLDRVELGVPRPRPQAPVAYALSPYDPVLPRTAGADYLIVTHQRFRAQADQIAALKAAEGFRPVVVDVARAYDRFSAGVFEAQAVRALIRHAARRGGAGYVLLVGDDTFDPRDRMGLGLVSYVPSLAGWDGEFGRVPSENRYADLDGDGSPEVAIGRLPVQTEDQADALVDKIARQSSVLEQGGTHLIAVDNDALGDAAFRADAEGVAARLGAAVAWADLGTGVAAARATLLDGLAAGAPTTHYFGHAGHERWADEGLLTTADVPGLASAGRETVLFTWACEAQWYQYDWGASLNEALLLAPQAGALAAVGPTGITDPVYQSALHKRLYGHFLAGVPLGEALRRAKAEVLALGPAFAPVAEGWSLLGDPALKLP
jgi:hypothetical protein